MITRDQFLAARSLPRQVVDVPELGETVIVQGLTGAQRDAFEQMCVTQRGRHREVNFHNARAKLVVLSVVNEDGSRMFRDEDVEAIGALPAALVDRIFSVAKRLSGLADEDVDELGKPSGGTGPGS